MEAVLGLDTSEFTKNANESSKHAKSFVADIGNKLSSLAATVGKGIAIGAGALATGFAAATKQAFDLSATLEQNLGGVEAVFGNVAEYVESRATYAARTMGVSMSDYLATVNQMGSLAQGVGIDVEKSATMSTEAMQRAADVASVMGLSSERAMESVAGMFKGNFEMMDNLGVAINDTALAQFALAQGIEKSTQEMSTQEKVLLAYELFMHRTAKYADNYRKENQTVAGSLEVVRAAWENFLVGTEDSAEILVDSLFDAGTAAYTSIKEITPRLWNNFTEAAQLAIPRIQYGWNHLWNETLPNLATKGTNLLIDGVNYVLGTNIPHIDTVDFPTWAELESKVSTWWNGSGDSVYEKLKNTLSWTFGELILPAADETSSTIQNWWYDSVEPSLSKALQWAFFEITLPAWMDIVDTATSWWENDIRPSFETLTKWVASPALPSWEDIQSKVSSWWSGIKSGIESITKFYVNYDIKRTYSTGELQDAAGQWSIDTTGGATTPVKGSHASGLAFVPYDGYVSELHYGEAVLPRQAAEEYRSYGGGADNTAILNKLDDVVSAISGMQVVMDGRSVGVVTTAAASRGIADETRRKRRYG